MRALATVLGLLCGGAVAGFLGKLPFPFLVGMERRYLREDGQRTETGKPRAKAKKEKEHDGAQEAP
jgi:hypothetical protein